MVKGQDMLTVSDIASATVARLKAVIPLLSASILPDLERPEQMSADILRTKHPKGLFIIGYQESVGPGGKAETVIVSVVCAAITPQKVVKLGQAARIALNDYQIAGATRFEFHKDEAAGSEAGIFVRNVQFRCQIPATPPRDTAAAITALNL